MSTLASCSLLCLGVACVFSSRRKLRGVVNGKEGGSVGRVDCFGIAGLCLYTGRVVTVEMFNMLFSLMTSMHS
jgi:hypothetical protein